MAIDLNKLKQASKNAAHKTNEQMSEEIACLLDSSEGLSVLKERLTAEGVPQDDIDFFCSEIACMMDKNALVLENIKKASVLGKALKALII